MTCRHCAGTCDCRTWDACQAADRRYHFDPIPEPGDDATFDEDDRATGGRTYG